MDLKLSDVNNKNDKMIVVTLDMKPKNKMERMAQQVLKDLYSQKILNPFKGFRGSFIGKPFKVK